MGRTRAEETCRIVIKGSELVELKRHAHEIPECPGLDRRIQGYDGSGPLRTSLDELDWLVAVLDAVLHDPKGYPCVEYEPWKLEYVPPTDERCVACRRLYDRLNQESDRLFEVARKKRNKIPKSRPETLMHALRYERALVYEALGQHKRARKDLERIYADDPGYEDVASRLKVT